MHANSEHIIIITRYNNNIILLHYYCVCDIGDTYSHNSVKLPSLSTYYRCLLETHSFNTNLRQGIQRVCMDDADFKVGKKNPLSWADTSRDI